MAWETVTGPCFACGRLFTFNAERVPSIRIEGVRRPVCWECMAAANAKREAQGLAPHPILPGAYEPREVP